MLCSYLYTIYFWPVGESLEGQPIYNHTIMGIERVNICVQPDEFSSIATSTNYEASFVFIVSTLTIHVTLF